VRSRTQWQCSMDSTLPFPGTHTTNPQSSAAHLLPLVMLKVLVVLTLLSLFGATDAQNATCNGEEDPSDCSDYGVRLCNKASIQGEKLRRSLRARFVLHFFDSPSMSPCLPSFVITRVCRTLHHPASRCTSPPSPRNCIFIQRRLMTNTLCAVPTALTFLRAEECPVMCDYCEKDAIETVSPSLPPCLWASARRCQR
jgi:hypothetical protein